MILAGINGLNINYYSIIFLKYAAAHKNNKMVQISKISGLVVSILLLVCFLFNASWGVSTVETQQLKNPSHQTRGILSDIPKPKGGDTMNKVVRIRLKSDFVNGGIIEFDLPKDMKIFYMADVLNETNIWSRHFPLIGSEDPVTAEELTRLLLELDDKFRLHSLSLPFLSGIGKKTGGSSYVSVMNIINNQYGHGLDTPTEWLRQFKPLDAISSDNALAEILKAASTGQDKWVYAVDFSWGRRKTSRVSHQSKKEALLKHEKSSWHYDPHKISSRLKDKLYDLEQSFTPVMGKPKALCGDIHILMGEKNSVIKNPVVLSCCYQTDGSMTRSVFNTIIRQKILLSVNYSLKPFSTSCKDIQKIVEDDLLTIDKMLDNTLVQKS